jgi:hypothetical protein
MIVSAMTILMGMYSGDHADVVMISDRRATPNSIGRKASEHAKERVYKTLRLGPQAAIGFAETVPLSNPILAGLLNLPTPSIGDDVLTDLVEDSEDSFNYTFDYVVDLLTEMGGAAIEWASPPPGIQASAILAGANNGRPTLATLSGATGWRVEPVFDGIPHSGPPGVVGGAGKEGFEKFITTPGLNYIEFLKAAVRFCADRYDSVSHNYVIRRLGTGFAREEGHVRRQCFLSRL